MHVKVVVDTPLRQQFTYEVPSGMDVRTGMRVVVPFGRREMTAYVLGEDTCPGEGGYGIKPVKRVVDKEPLFGIPEVDLALWMSRFYLCSQGEALSCMIPGGRRDTGLPAMAGDDEDAAGCVLTLSDEQSSALEDIWNSNMSMHYLHGVTGSGKSEVFLRLSERVIASGRQVVYLVPEITLTHQLAALVMKRFGGRVAILHSALTPSQRIAQWRKIKRGEVDLAIGARSAVFAPFERLGLIIIDEEHENSYKAGNTPRYHARQVAQKRAQDTSSLLVMGSATPSLEAWYMMQEGHVKRHVLAKRVAGGVPPMVAVVNLLGEDRIVSKKLESAMKDVLGRGRQVILFLNRRGFSRSFHCRSCGYEMTCPHCSVSLTYHKQMHAMVCHYCGYRRSPLSVCPVCSSVDVGYAGFGTEQVEQEVKSLFPTARIARLDTDSAQDKKTVKPVLDAFHDGRVDILLGTQMVAKGLNFPSVELVGILLADSGLNIPDFRAQERTFALIVQVSGRAGRYNDQGKVIVQTYHPENDAIRLACSGDLETFYARELEMRRETGFPPYTRLVNYVVRGRAKERVEADMSRLVAVAREALSWMESHAVETADLPVVLGSAECPIEKIAGNWRHQMLVRGSNPAQVLRMVSLVDSKYKVSSGCYLEVDIDPLQMM